MSGLSPLVTLVTLFTLVGCRVGAPDSPTNMELKSPKMEVYPELP